MCTSVKLWADSGVDRAARAGAWGGGLAEGQAAALRRRHIRNQGWPDLGTGGAAHQLRRKRSGEAGALGCPVRIRNCLPSEEGSECQTCSDGSPDRPPKSVLGTAEIKPMDEASTLADMRA